MTEQLLKSRIQELEKEICERTRSYLRYTNKHNRMRYFRTEDSISQTDPVPETTLGETQTESQ